MTDLMDRIILTSPIYIKGRDCGYCNGEKDVVSATKALEGHLPPTSITFGSQVELMKCQDYDELVNMGFRRSGQFLYKTDMLRNCCRYYTIRTSLLQMKLQKTHRQVINRFVRQISDPDAIKHTNRDTETKGFDVNVLIDAETESKRFYTRFEPSMFSQEKFELYKKYQVSVHNDDPEEVSPKQFTRFLCDSPFDEEIAGVKEEWDGLKSWKTNKPSKVRVGPTHECYYLDDKLIAISVMDFLPSGISSVYFIWDPDYAKLSLGTVSAIRELLMVQKLGLQYYYLGYYIEDCPKMVYKGKYGGELLDLVNEQYYPLESITTDIANSKLFVMGEKGTTDERFLSFKYPTKGTYTDNIVEDLYTPEKLAVAHEAAKNVYKTLDVEETPFPDIVPGLMPITQLQTVTADARFQTRPVSLYQVFRGGVELKQFKSMTEEERIAVINCVRIFGLERLARLLIIMY